MNFLGFNGLITSALHKAHMNIEILQDMAAWARSRVISGEEPPWTFEKLRQLNEICAELAASMETTSASFSTQKAIEPELEAHLPSDHLTKAKVVSLNRFRSRPDEAETLPLPM